MATRITCRIDLQAQAAAGVDQVTEAKEQASTLRAQ